MAARVSRVLAVGISGSGKTRLARQLGTTLQLPVIHLDSFFWCNGWRERDPAQVMELIRDALDEDVWIMEGYVEPLGRERVARADVVVYLDVSGTAAAVGVLARWLRHHRRGRPEMPATNTESLSIDFLRMVARRLERGEIEALIGGADKVVRVRRRRRRRRDARQLSPGTLVTAGATPAAE